MIKYTHCIKLLKHDRVIFPLSVSGMLGWSFPDERIFQVGVRPVEIWPFTVETCLKYVLVMSLFLKQTAPNITTLLDNQGS